MGFFNKAKMVVSNYWKVSTSLRPFFVAKEKVMQNSYLVPDNIPDEIVQIYNTIKSTEPDKYKNDINKYENLSSLISKHNKTVNEIDTIIDRWDLEKAMSNPVDFSPSDFQRLDYAVNMLKRFFNLQNKHDLFIEQYSDFKNNYDEICKEFNEIDEYNEIFDFSRYQYMSLKDADHIQNKIKGIFDKFDRTTNFFYPYDKHRNVNELIVEHNEQFINQNKNNPLFNDINGKSLDNEQRTAVLIEEQSELVVAGAGSGKTLTICGKVEYLLNKGIKPEDILLLSYSKKSADDLQSKIEKINNKLTVGTFHKIGLDILKKVEEKSLVVDSQYKSIIESYFREDMRDRPNALQTIMTYYALYLNNYKHSKKYDDEGELYEDLKKSDFMTLKNQLISMSNDVYKKETIKKELVKSFEEMAIANWYFIHGVDYVYEKPYEKDVSTYDRRQYLPDFYLPKYKIYHEHYGINKDGKADQYSGTEAQTYVANMAWKKAIHQQNNTICIETYSYEFGDGTIFDKLEKELKSRGVVFKPLSDEQVFNALESIYEGKQFKSFINLIRTFLSLYKSTYRDAKGFDKLRKYEFANQYDNIRASLFLDIVEDIYQYYMAWIRKDGKIDFDDMILQSTAELDNVDGYKYKYIIVDEFQDISVSRMIFLKKLIEHGGSKLFAVGDDWQAIYRFSGCDLNIFLHFSDYFGDTKVTKITSTHRNSQQLQDIAGPFITANPEQISKTIKSNKSLDNPVQIMYYSDKKYNAFIDVLSIIHKIDKNAKVLILGRNNKDFDDIALDNRIYIDSKSSTDNKRVVKVTRFPDMQLTYNTVHGSKGLEEDYVIIINADDTRLGFPNKMEDDVLLDMVLSSKSGYVYAEERRLWYVALTRTRNYTFIIANKDNPSMFVKEIEDHCLIINPDLQPEETSEILCPRCKSGKLVLRVNESDRSEFFGCSNYPYCNYSINDIRAVKRNKRCPSCGDIMVFKRGRYGAFYGCHNYPRCKYKEEYNG